VVGDYVLDRYHFCDAAGVAGEGPMLSLKALQRKDYDGGAGVLALHLAGLGAAPTLVTALADDDLSRQVALRLAADGVDVRGITGRRSLVAKHRYLVDQTKLFKVDEGSAAPADSRMEEVLADKILAAIDGAAAVVFADFGYGVITAGLLDRVLPELRRRVPVLAANASGKQSHLLHFRGVDLLCPTEREVREARHDFADGLGAVVWDLLNATDAKAAIVTLGKQGLVTFDRNDLAAGERLLSEYLPALSGVTVDPLGCGDALLSTATLALAAGGSLQAAAFLGALAAAVEVREVGNVPVTADAVLALLRARDRANGAASDPSAGSVSTAA
jgi:rfaE bifunctional protein kinase chain/domain